MASAHVLGRRPAWGPPLARTRRLSSSHNETFTMLATSRKPHQTDTGFDQVSQSKLMDHPRPSASSDSAMRKHSKELNALMTEPFRRAAAAALARDPEKWEPVFGKDHAQTNNIERDGDSKKSHPALGRQRGFRHRGGAEQRLELAPQ